MIKLDSSKIDSSVLFNLEKAENNMKESYNLSIDLKRNLSNITSLQDVVNDVNDIKLNINNINTSIVEGVRKVELLEQKSKKNLYQIRKLNKEKNDSNRRRDIRQNKTKDNSFTEKLTDKQYNWMASLSGKFSEKPQLFIENKGNYICSVDKAYENLCIMSDGTPIGGYKIHDVIIGEDGFSVLVLEDDVGNYTMVYPCTKKTLEDYLYDLYPVLVDMGVYNPYFLRGLLDKLDFKSVIELVKKFIPEEDLNKFGIDLEKLGNLNGSSVLDYAKHIYESQQAQSKEIALKYLTKANSEDVVLNFFGFSKGGGMAERAYLECSHFLSFQLFYMPFNDSSTFVNPNVLGEIVLYNPLHDNLTENEVSILKESGDYKLYRQQGDFVSMIHNEDDFDDMTTFIKCDWNELINEGSWDIIGLISGTTHIPSSSRGSYDKYGNAIKVDKVSYEELSKYVFETEDVLGKFSKIVSALSNPLLLTKIDLTGAFVCPSPLTLGLLATNTTESVFVGPISLAVDLLKTK